MALIGIVLFISVPRFRNTVLTDPAKQTSRWIIGAVSALKESSVQNQHLYSLTVDITDNRLRAGIVSEPESTAPSNKLHEYKVPEGARILDVEFPGKDKISSGKANIFFYRRGYSDKAYIHIESDNRAQWTLLIEPFLSSAILYDHYVEFEN